MDTPHEYQGLGHAVPSRSELDALLSRMCKARDSGQRRRFERLRNEVVSGNLRLVYSVAIRHQRRGLELPDLVSEGVLGLMHALDKFDPACGCQLSTYATWWIRQAIRRSIQDKARAVRVPVHRLEGAGALHKPRARFEAQHGRAPTADELARLVKRKARNVRADLDAAQAHMMSLDAPLTEDEAGTWLDSMPGAAPSPLDALLSRERAAYAQAALAALPAREAAVLRARMSDDAPTLADIGKGIPSQVGGTVCRERVRQLQRDGLVRLRQRGACDELR